MVFDEFDNGVNFGTEGLFVTAVGDGDGGVVFVVFGDDGEGGGDVGEEAELGAVGIRGFGAKNFLGKSGDASDATEFGEIADDDFFGAWEVRDFALRGGDTETDENDFFQLTHALSSDGEGFSDLLECLFLTGESKTFFNDFALAILVDNTETTCDCFRNQVGVLFHWLFPYFPPRLIMI